MSATCRRTSRALLGVEQVPLVEHDHDRGAGGVDALGEPLVLVGHALGRVDRRTARRRRGRSPRARARGCSTRSARRSGSCGAARGVDETQRPVFGLDHGVDRVAGRAGQVVHDRALLADQPVEQRRLADVRAVRRSRPRRCRRRSAASCAGTSSSVGSGSAATTASSSSPDSRPWIADTGHGSPRPSRRNWSDVGLAPLVVDLVDHDDHRHVAALEHARATCASSSVMPVVTSTTSSTRSASRIAASACAVTLAASAGGSAVSPASPGPQPAAGVDEHERAAVPLGDELAAVAGDARALLDDRGAPADDAVHERRLADVRTADDGDARASHGCRSRRRPRDRADERGAVGGDDLDRARQLGDRLAVEEPAARQHDVGQQVAVAGGLRRRARRRRRRRSAGR